MTDLMTQTRKCIAKSKNSNGVVFALIAGTTGYEVWKRCENYSGKCKGGIAYTWRYIQKSMSEESAVKLFNQRIK